MSPRASLKAFLATARAALTAPRTTPLTFVVGNESADLDSLCSALLLAYFHTYAPPKTPGLASTNSTLHIPLCHLHRPDLALRPEFAAVLRDVDVQSADVLTLEDVPSCLRPEDTRWLLVDHNAMTGALGARFASRVIGCIDHHVDERVIPSTSEPRIIEKSGSCASLVLAHCRRIWDGLDVAADVDAQIARVALASILVDTSGLRDGARTTVWDERAVEIAEGRLGGGEEGYGRVNLFRRLDALKADLDGMSMRDVLRKDYKEWRVGERTVGTSSVTRGFGYLLRDKGGGDVGIIGEAIGSWGEERDGDGRVDLVVILTAFVDDGVFRRELLVWARSVVGVRAARRFEEKHGDELGLKAWEGGRLDLDEGEDGSQWRRCWTQGTVGCSRKQIAPMLRDVLQEVAG
ncbi:exopolyphosphatase-like protein [Xylaria nigripes]|nr:exopolyphosphatase-like protein [Xylaria nigripes]